MRSSAPVDARECAFVLTMQALGLMGDVNSFARRSATLGYVALIFIGLILSRPNDFGLNSTAVAPQGLGQMRPDGEDEHDHQPTLCSCRCIERAGGHRFDTIGFGCAGPDLENLSPVPWRHDRRRGFPRSAMAQIRGRAREADEWRARRAGLPQFVADEDRGAIFRGTQRCARSQSLSDLLRRRGVRRAQYWPDAWTGELLQTRCRLEASRGWPE